MVRPALTGGAFLSVPQPSAPLSWIGRQILATLDPLRLPLIKHGQALKLRMHNRVASALCQFGERGCTLPHLFCPIHHA